MSEIPVSSGSFALACLSLQFPFFLKNTGVLIPFYNSQKNNSCPCRQLLLLINNVLFRLFTVFSRSLPIHRIHDSSYSLTFLDVQFQFSIHSKPDQWYMRFMLNLDMHVYK